MKKNNYLTLGGLFVALHLLFIFLSKVLVGSELILVIFLPLLSTIYTLNFKWKEVTMFIIATFLLCAIFEPITSLIYVVPALVCGTLYGTLRKTKIKDLSLLYITTLSHSLSLLISFLSISLLFKEVNFFSIFEMFIDKEGNAFYVSVYLVLILLGLLESFIVHIITNNELERLGYKEIESETKVPTWMTWGLALTSLVYLVLAIIDPILTVYAFPFVLAFYLPNVVESMIDNKRNWLYLVVGFMFIGAMFLIKFLNPIFYPILLMGVSLPFLLEKIVRVLYTFLSKYLNNGKNNIE